MNDMLTIYGTTWAILPSYLRAISAAWSSHMADILDAVKRRAEERAAAAKVSGASRPKSDIAVVPVVGPISHRPTFMSEECGWPTSSTLADTVEALVADQSVKAIVLDMDTPGGVAVGVPEAASRIYRARGAKPIVAVANGMAASAGYWLASAADKIYVTPSGEVGSIGVVSIHFDQSKAMEDAGIKPTVFRSAKYKAEFNPYEPLSDDARDHEQASIDGIYTEFVNAVATHRGVPVAKVRAEFGEGRTVGARQAVSLGMADGVATLQQVISRVRSGKLTMATLGSQAADWSDEPTLCEIDESERLAGTESRRRRFALLNKETA